MELVPPGRTSHPIPVSLYRLSRRRSSTMKAKAIVIVALAVLAIPAFASAETPQFTPVNFGVGPVETSDAGNFVVTFDVYMTSTTQSSQTKAAALNMTSCNGVPLQLAHRTRHLSNGESLVQTKGGGPYDDVTGLRWTRPSGTPAAGNPAVLQMSFIGVQPGYFCLMIQDASDPFGPRYASVDIGMK